MTAAPFFYTIVIKISKKVFKKILKTVERLARESAFRMYLLLEDRTPLWEADRAYRVDVSDRWNEIYNREVEYDCDSRK